MRPFTDYETTPEFTVSEKLPAGAYVVKIKRAEESDGALCILFDIDEGEFKDFYMDKFQSDKKNFPDNAKYKGVYRLWYPSGKEYDEMNKKRMKTVLKLIKEENKLKVDFSKEWDGNALKGAKLVLVFQEQEYDYNGHHGFTAQPYGVITMESYKAGKYTIPAPKKLKASSSAASVDDFVEASGVGSDEDLPF